MYCPNCKSKIEHQNKHQCPKCNTLLWEKSEQRIAVNGVETGEYSGHAGTAAGKSKSDLQEPDEFDQFLKDIATEVDRIITLDKDDTADSKAELEEEDQQSANVSDAVIELTDEFEHQDQETGNADILKKDKTLTEDSDEAIDLFDIMEPEVYKKDEFTAKAPGVEVESTLKPEPAAFEDNGLIEEITEQDFIYADVPDLVYPDEGEAIEEITEQDFLFVEAPAHSVNQRAYLEHPTKTKRFSKAAFIAALMAVLLIAAVFGGMFYFKIL